MHDICGVKRNYNMKREIILFVSFVIMSTVSFSQEGLSTYEKILDKVNRDMLFTPNVVRYEAIDGTPYLTDSFFRGIVIMNSGDTLEGEFRFDVYANQIEFRKNGTILAIATPDSLSKIVFDDYTLTYKKFKAGLDSGKGYFMLLAEGEFNLLLQKTVILYQAEPAKPYTDPRPARFENGKEYLFLQTGSNPAEKVTKEEEILRFLGDRSGEAKQYADKEKLNLKKQPDVIELVKYLNQK